MTKNEFLHNGEIVKYQEIFEDTFVNVLCRNGVASTELPDSDMSYTVYKYFVDGMKKYACVVWTADHMNQRVFITESIPEDGWKELMLDVYGQSKGEEPRKITTRKEIALALAEKKAFSYAEKKYPDEITMWMLCGYPENVKEEMDIVINDYMAMCGY